MQFTDEQKKIVENLFNEGITLGEIAKILNSQRRTIGKLCKYLGLNRSRSEAASLKIQSPLIDKLDIIKWMRERGDSFATIAEAVGGSISAIHRLCEVHNIISPPKERIDYTDLKKLYEDGLNIQQLSDKFGVSCVVIHKHLKKQNTQIRQPAVAGFTGSGHRETVLDPQSAIIDYRSLGSMSKVAAKHGYSIAGIRRILEKQKEKILTSSQILCGDGNPFFGQQHH
jgi:predicted DNA-binding protein YlxM (UPF0122 family)